MTTPNDVANGSEIARKPKTMSRMAHTIDGPEPKLESFASAMILFLLAIGRFADDLEEANNTNAVELLELPDAAGADSDPRWRAAGLLFV
jgi:hypothetical protein